MTDEQENVELESIVELANTILTPEPSNEPEQETMEQESEAVAETEEEAPKKKRGRKPKEVVQDEPQEKADVVPKGRSEWTNVEAVKLMRKGYGDRSIIQKAGIHAGISLGDAIDIFQKAKGDFLDKIDAIVNK